MIDDGAYVARASLGPMIPESARTLVEPQDAFNTALRRRFYAHRAQLHLHPTMKAVTALDDGHAISFAKGNSKAVADWQRFLRQTEPHRAQLQSMEQSTVFDLLELLQKHLLLRTKEIAGTTSAWIWALLARLDDVGTMNNDQVWILRELGKKAVLVQLSLVDPVAAEMLERESTGEHDSDVAAQVDDQANARATENADFVAEPNDARSMPVASKLDVDTLEHDTASKSLHENTLATLDMIITIVGEIFGQRDLLEFRKPWTSVEDMLAEREAS